jgi:hypothetical protein
MMGQSVCFPSLALVFCFHFGFLISLLQAFCRLQFHFCSKNWCFFFFKFHFAWLWFHDRFSHDFTLSHTCNVILPFISAKLVTFEMTVL